LSQAQFDRLLPVFSNIYHPVFAQKRGYFKVGIMPLNEPRL